MTNASYGHTCLGTIAKRLLILAFSAVGYDRCTTTLQAKKGETMKRNCFRFFAPFFAAAFLGAFAQGQETDRLLVNIPYDFVVSGKTLPAGTYRVERVADNDQRQLLISGVENRTSILTMSSEVDDVSQDRPALTFVLSGGQHLLAQIQTGEHVFKIPVSSHSVQSPARNSKGGDSPVSDTTKP
jgi:hypothetical protein